jgi:hypothetical protein
MTQTIELEDTFPPNEDPQPHLEKAIQWVVARRDEIIRADRDWKISTELTFEMVSEAERKFRVFCVLDKTSGLAPILPGDNP